MSRMIFPDDVLDIIQEYSRPATRVDWRTCRANEAELVSHIYHNVLHYILHENFYMNAQQSEWYRFNQHPGRLAWKE